MSFLGPCAIKNHSTNQPLSSADAKYVALSQATQELLWILKVCDDLNIPQNLPIKMFEDNQSTSIKLVESEKYKSRSKHIDAKDHFMKDLKSKSIINAILLTDKRNDW